MFSDVGLAFVVAVGAELAFDPSRRRLLLSLVVPVAGFIVWFLAFNTGSVTGAPGASSTFLHGPTGWDFVSGLTSFVATGLGASFAGLVGIIGIASPLFLVIIAALVAFDWYFHGALTTWQIGLIAGVLFWFLLVGLGRAQYGAFAATQSRYLYVGSVFLLPLAAHWIRHLPWQGLLQPALASALALLVLVNIVQLADIAISQTALMKTEVAELQTVDLFRDAPDMARRSDIDDSVMKLFVAGDYLDASKELGSPVSRLTLDGLRQLPHAPVDTVMRNLFGPAITVTGDRARSEEGLACRNVDSTVGATIDFQAPGGRSLMLSSEQAGNARLYLGFFDPPTSEAVQNVNLFAAMPEWIRLPDTGKPTDWQLRVTTGPVGKLEVCGNGTMQVRERSD
jgi:hypothetical protein